MSKFNIVYMKDDPLLYSKNLSTNILVNTYFRIYLKLLAIIQITNMVHQIGSYLTVFTIEFCFRYFPSFLMEIWSVFTLGILLHKNDFFSRLPHFQFWSIRSVDPPTERTLQNACTTTNILIGCVTFGSLTTGALFSYPTNFVRKYSLIAYRIEQFNTTVTDYLLYAYMANNVFVFLSSVLIVNQIIYFAHHIQMQVFLLRRLVHAMTDEEIDVNLAFIVRRHSAILKCCKEALKRRKVAILLSVLIFFLLGISMLIQVLRGVLEGVYLVNFIGSLTAIAAISGLNYRAERMEEEFELFFDDVRSFSFYTWRNKRNLKDYIVFINFANQSLRLEYNESLAFGWNFAMKLIKTVFSYTLMYFQFCYER